nr:surface lipoprotein assembly modifier [Glaesserella parasuis]
MSYSFWLSQNWQNQTVLEYEKRRFFKDNPQARHIRTASTTLIWYRNPEQIFLCQCRLFSATLTRVTIQLRYSEFTFRLVARIRFWDFN